MAADSGIYVSMMTDSLQKKKDILTDLYEQTKEQESLLSDGKMDVDRFEALIEEKGRGIDELNSLDNGFDSLFKKLGQELTVNRGAYEKEIIRMKGLISDITELSSGITVLEKRNHDRFAAYISDERRKLRDANRIQQTAVTYAQNMSGYHKPGSSYFVNETK